MPPVRRALAFVVVALAACLVGAQLFVTPIVGFADNGDFRKVMQPAGLGYLTDRYEERYWNWALTKFAIVETLPAGGEAPSPEALLAMAAVSLNRLFAPGTIFDIRFLGAIHGALLIGFLALVAAACRDLVPAAFWAALGLTVLFFTDVGYVAPFNSLYRQVASLIFFLLAAGIAAEAVRRGRLEAPALFFYFVCAACFAASKPQEAIQGPILAALGYLLARGPTRRVWREPAAWMGLLVCVIATWSYAATPLRSIRQASLYDSVFIELLSTSDDPDGDLVALGLDQALRRFVGVNAYSPVTPLADPEFQEAFFGRLGYGTLIRFYATHPSRLNFRLRRYGSLAFRLRPSNFGNFAQASGRPAGSLSHRFEVWSSARSKLGRYGVLWISALIGATAVAAISLAPRSPRGRLFRDALMALCVMATVEFCVCTLADFTVEAERHLFVFQAMWDVILIVDVAWMTQAFGTRLRPSGTATA